MQRKRKKTPSDYPQLCFRLPSEEERKRIDSLIEEIQDAYNKRRKEGDLVIRRNDVVLDALERGLKAIKRSLA
jgi:hypothetical protein